MAEKEKKVETLKLKDKKAIPLKPGDSMIASRTFENKAGKDELAVTKGDMLELVAVDDKLDTWWNAKNLTTKKKGWISSSIMLAPGNLDLEEWCHGKITRNAAEFLLNKEKKHGNFIVRESQSIPGDYTLTLMDNGKIVHYRINETDKGVGIGPSKLFATVQLMISYYKEKAEGICCKLTDTLPKAHSYPMIISKENYLKWELKSSDITKVKLLGAGNFGEVYDGTHKGEPVAIKLIKETAMEFTEFIQEAHVMKNLRHPHLVNLIGTVFSEMPMLIILEMVSKGDLLSYMRRKGASKEIDESKKLSICSQVCDGMTFLERRKTIHRDLAARNCLVGENLHIKIADFGMGRVIDGIYTARTGTKMPVKWSAPEALCFNAFSIKSDVWSFGIILWEIVTLGDVPYEGIESSDVLSKLEAKYRMPLPDKCNKKLYAIMLKTWEYQADDRPSFLAIMDLLDDIKTEEELALSTPFSKALKWREELKKKPEVVLEFERLVPVVLPLVQNAFTRCQHILKYSVDDYLNEDLSPLVEFIKEFSESGKSLKNFPDKKVAEAFKGAVSGGASFAKNTKPLAKIRPGLETLKQMLQFLHNSLREI